MLLLLLLLLLMGAVWWLGEARDSRHGRMLGLGLGRRLRRRH
jgi:hypothetical protein